MMKKYLLSKVSLLSILSLGFMGVGSILLNLSDRSVSASPIRLACIKKKETNQYGFTSNTIYNLVDGRGQIINQSTSENECQEVRNMFLSTGFACIKHIERHQATFTTSTTYELVNIHGESINTTTRKNECLQELSQY